MIAYNIYLIKSEGKECNMLWTGSYIDINRAYKLVEEWNKKYSNGSVWEVREIKE